MPYVKGKTFDIQFTFNRLSMQMEHRACERIASVDRLDMRHVLFPKAESLDQRGEINKQVRQVFVAGEDPGGGCRGFAPHPPPPQMTCGFLIQLVLCNKRSQLRFSLLVHPLLRKILDPPLCWELRLKLQTRNISVSERTSIISSSKATISVLPTLNSPFQVCQPSSRITR